MTDLQIAYFLEAAECLNFTEAARHFFIAQPTLSKQIAQMEEELGVQLFFRTNRRVQLTGAGQYLRQEFSILAQQKELVIQQAQQLENGGTGRLCIGIQDILWADPFLSRLLLAFQRQHPEIQYSIAVHTYQPLLEKLRGGEVDIALSKQFRAIDFPGLYSQKLRDDTACLLVHKDNPLAEREEVALADLRDQKFIVLGQDVARFSGSTLVSACRAAGFQPRISYFANCNMARILYVELGMGITLMDNGFEIGQNSSIRRVALKSEGLEQTGTYAVSLKDAAGQTVQTFFEFLRTLAVQL